MNRIFISLAGLSLLMGSGCATIVSGSRQNIKFSSTPSAATIYIDEVEVGKTPFEMKLKRLSEHHVMVKLEGYKTYETTLTKKLNGWFFGNIAFGGIIGLIVDPITGAMYNLSPKEIHAKMNQGITFVKREDELYVAVSMEIDPGWQKIGQLEKADK